MKPQLDLWLKIWAQITLSPAALPSLEPVEVLILKSFRKIPPDHLLPSIP